MSSWTESHLAGSPLATATAESENKVPWRPVREWELWILIALVVGTYFVRLTDLSIRGEESRRALVGIEMLASGDWIVPRQQGNPFFMSSRPPLQSWTMAMIGKLRGGIDAYAIRLPSTVSLLMVVVLVYCYGRLFLSRLGAFSAGAAFATFTHIMELGRLGETDLMFTLLVSASLLLWHTGFVRGWPAGCTWCAGYLCAALATLTKGPQAPVYFAGPVIAYLVVTRQWRFAVSRAHLLGLLGFVLVLGSWQVPFFQAMGVPGVRHIYGGDAAMYVRDRRLSVFAEHLVEYPVKILFTCLIPWSVLLIGFLRRDFRAALGPARPHVKFLAIALATTFPTVWIVPTSEPRFYMALYPSLALLVGVAIQLCVDAGAGVEYHKLWKFFAGGMALLILAAGPVVLTGVLLDDGRWNLGQPLWFAAVFCAACLVLAKLAWESRLPASHAVAARGVMGIAVFLGMCSTGLYLNQRIAASSPNALEMARLMRNLPSDARLVSLGPVTHLFNWMYGKPIPALAIPAASSDVPQDLEYFCIMSRGMERPNLCFEWDEVGAVICDRCPTPSPEKRVVVGRRHAASGTGAAVPVAAEAAGDGATR